MEVLSCHFVSLLGNTANSTGFARLVSSRSEAETDQQLVLPRSGVRRFLPHRHQLRHQACFDLEYGPIVFGIADVPKLIG